MGARQHTQMRTTTAPVRPRGVLCLRALALVVALGGAWPAVVGQERVQPRGKVQAVFAPSGDLGARRAGAGAPSAARSSRHEERGAVPAAAPPRKADVSDYGALGLALLALALWSGLRLRRND